MWGYSLYFTICTFFQVNGLADIQTCVMIISVALYWPLIYLFIYSLNCGFKGAAVATTASQLTSPSLMICYALGTKSGRAHLPSSKKYDGTTKEMIQYAIYSSSGIHQYLGLALSGLLVVSEWWASETVIFLSGTLKPDSSLGKWIVSCFLCVKAICTFVVFLWIYANHVWQWFLLVTAALLPRNQII